MRIERVSLGSSITTLCIELIFIIWPFGARFHSMLSVTAPSRQVKATNPADRRHHGGRPICLRGGTGAKLAPRNQGREYHVAGDRWRRFYRIERRGCAERRGPR